MNIYNTKYDEFTDITLRNIYREYVKKTGVKYNITYSGSDFSVNLRSMRHNPKKCTDISSN